MSIPVPLDGLRAALAERGDAAYVLTVSDDLRPHVVHATVRWGGDALVVDVGRRSVILPTDLLRSHTERREGLQAALLLRTS